MHGRTAARACKMITQSDDAIASAFYGSVGGDWLINWIKSRYHVPDLGYPPSRAGLVGQHAPAPVRAGASCTRSSSATPRRAVAAQRDAPRASDTARTAPTSSSGSRRPPRASRSSRAGATTTRSARSADFNTTGFVDNDRYAVAILARGPSSTYGSAIGTCSPTSRGGCCPAAPIPTRSPTFVSMSPHIGATAGGTRVTVHGTDLTHVTKVMFGDKRGARPAGDVADQAARHRAAAHPLDRRS